MTISRGPGSVAASVSAVCLPQVHSPDAKIHCRIRLRDFAYLITLSSYPTRRRQAQPRMEFGRQQGAWLIFGGDLTSLLLKALEKSCGEKHGAALALVNIACAQAVKSDRDLMARKRVTYNNNVKEHLVADLGSLPDDVLIEILIALQQEAHSRSQDSDWRRALASTAGASVKFTLRHVSDDALLQIVAAVQLEASRRDARYAYGRFRLASAASGCRRTAASDSPRPLQARIGRFRRRFWATSRSSVGPADS